jgi:hypothetical protein
MEDWLIHRFAISPLRENIFLRSPPKLIGTNDYLNYYRRSLFDPNHYGFLVQYFFFVILRADSECHIYHLMCIHHTYIDQLFIPPPILKVFGSFNHGIYFFDHTYNFLIGQTFFSAHVLPAKCSIANSPLYIAENNINTRLFNKPGR